MEILADDKIKSYKTNCCCQNGLNGNNGRDGINGDKVTIR